MSRTTTARLKNAVRRLNFALEIVQHSKGEYIVAQIRTNNRPRWALQRDYASGPVAVTGYRPAGDILRHIEAMLDGIAAARGLAVPRSIYDGFIKRDPPAAVTSRGLETADGESVCEFCNRVGPGSPAKTGEDTIHYCEACRANDALGAADCCPITGDEYGTPS